MMRVLSLVATGLLGLTLAGVSAGADRPKRIPNPKPAPGPWLLPPCTLRHHAQVRPVCPEGDRFCGVVVWKQDATQYVRTL